MKSLILFLVLLCYTGNAQGSIPKRTGCNQQLYDAIYREITMEAITAGLRAMTDTEQALVYQHRAEYIISLRALCKGQRSSYERVKP